MTPKILGIITARGGSKGIPGKNIKRLGDKPLLAHTIEAAKESGVFDRIILSTDDPAIAEVARTYACEVPFMRPAELARDATPHLAVLQHAVEWLKGHENYAPDLVMILQPTSPLRSASHIREAVELLEKTGADSVVSVSLVPRHHHPQWQCTVGDDRRLQLFTGDPLSQVVHRRQDLGSTYARNGAIYLFKTHLLHDSVSPGFYGDDVVAYVMHHDDSINIDNMEDWEAAERIVRLRACRQ